MSRFFFSSFLIVSVASDIIVCYSKFYFFSLNFLIFLFFIVYYAFEIIACYSTFYFFFFFSSFIYLFFSYLIFFSFSTSSLASKIIYFNSYFSLRDCSNFARNIATAFFLIYIYVGEIFVSILLFFDFCY